MKKYLFDTNICIFYFKNKFGIEDKIKAVGEENVYVSEVTIAELLYGVANTTDPDKRAANRKVVDIFKQNVNIIPIASVFEEYAKEKSRLRKLGTPVDDFDLLIGATAIAHDLVMVTNNLKHIGRLEGITLEDWTQV